MIPDQRRLSVENNEEIQAELNSGDSEKESEKIRRGKTLLLYLFREIPSPWSKKKMISLTKMEHNSAFESGRRKCELKGIKNTFPGIPMDSSSWRDPPTPASSWHRQLLTAYHIFLLGWICSESCLSSSIYPALMCPF